MPPTPSNELDAADALFNSQHFTAARTAYSHLLASTTDPSLQTEAAAMIARTFLTCDLKDPARPWLEQARLTADPAHPHGYARYLATRGRMEWKDHQFDAAQSTFKSLYDYCHTHHFTDRAIDALRMLAILSPLPQQIEWSQRAIAEAAAAQLHDMLPSLYNNLGASHEDLGQHAQALDAYLLARDYHRQFSPPLQQLKADYAVAHAQRLLGRLDEARALLTLLLPAFEDLSADESAGWTCHELAHIELAQNNRALAHDFFLRAKSHLLDAGIATWDPHTLERIIAQITLLTPA